MNSQLKKWVVATVVFTGLLSCKKNESTAIGNTDYAVSEPSKEMVSDSVSMAATQNIAGKKFVKNASVTMEVKEVYQSVIAIENQLKKIGGYVEFSKTSSETSSEETYPISDTEAKLVKKYKQTNEMQVRVPTEKLGVFLDFVNQSNLFLQDRTISAEDVSSNITMAKLEEKRHQKTQENIGKIANNEKKVSLADGNFQDQNNLKMESYRLDDRLKYSAVTLHLAEPSERVAIINIANTNNFDSEFRNHFFYDIKNALIKGFYWFQSVLVGLFYVWPLFVIIFCTYFVYRKYKTKKIKTL